MKELDLSLCRQITDSTSNRFEEIEKMKQKEKERNKEIKILIFQSILFLISVLLVGLFEVPH